VDKLSRKNINPGRNSARLHLSPAIDHSDALKCVTHTAMLGSQVNQQNWLVPVSSLACREA